MNRYTIREHKYESDSPMARLQELEDKIEDGTLVEVRYGKWIEHPGFNSWCYECPFCDKGWENTGMNTISPKYCFNCGARLDGKESDTRG